jgi:hypothetical protein
MPRSKKIKAEIKPEAAPDNNLIDRGAYVIHFVKPDNESLKNNLTNTGRIIGQVAIDCNTANDGIDELLIVVKK